MYGKFSNLVHVMHKNGVFSMVVVIRSLRCFIKSLELIILHVIRDLKVIRALKSFQL